MKKTHITLHMTMATAGMLCTSVVAENINVPADYPTIQQAIADAAPGDAILVQPGTYFETIDFLGKTIAVRSIAGPDETIIDIEPIAESGPVVSAVSGEWLGTIFDGFTITGGHSSMGGGMRLIDSSLDVRNCIFVDNSATRGGGIYAHNSFSLHVTDCVFRANTAEQEGGGLYTASGPVPEAMFSQFTVANAEFNGNSAGQGGGMHIEGGQVMVVNGSFAGNQSSSIGGAVLVESGSVTFANSAFGGNFEETAAQFGRDFWVLDEGFLFITNSCNPFLFESDGVAGGIGIITFGDNVFTADLSPIAGIPFMDWLGDDGQPGTGDEDLRLAAGSACIDAGTNFAVPFFVETDLAGNPRFVDDPDSPDTGEGVGALVDMGAFEFQPSLVSADFDDDGLIGPSDLAILLGHWGPCQPRIDCPADLNGDNTVDAADLAVLLGSWG